MLILFTFHANLIFYLVDFYSKYLLFLFVYITLGYLRVSKVICFQHYRSCLFYTSFILLYYVVYYHAKDGILRYIVGVNTICVPLVLNVQTCT